MGRTENIKIPMICTIVGALIGACVTFYTLTLNSQTAFWKDRSNLLKDNFDKMKVEADKLANQCSQEKSNDPAVKNIKERIDGIYRKTIPVSKTEKFEKL